MFSLDPSILTEKLNSDLEDDKLTISAPSKVNRIPEYHNITSNMIGSSNGEAQLCKLNPITKGRRKISILIYQ